MLRYRIASAVILIPIVLGSVYFGGLSFFAVATVAMLIGGYEFFEMARRAGHRPITLFGLALIALFLFDAFAHTDTSFKVVFGQESWLHEIVAAALVFSLGLAVFWREEDWIASWALTFAGALYVGWLGAYAILVRDLPNGLIWTAIALVTVWATDTGAYFVGTRIGRHGFFTSISPKKTWEGAIGGIVLATLTMLVLGSVFAGTDLLQLFVFGFGLSIAATFGDLAESLLKRQTGVKDSGNIVPGHGGLLDRIDSLLFAAVFAYYYLVWVLRIVN
ncbi:MAG: phosphatidate cytidylyltransferase [Chloroflexota bacterium]|nr:phosphatidate cytidylyltransferase [Chloroflexota bacterium]